jgi:hypothetical protein
MELPSLPNFKNISGGNLLTPAPVSGGRKRRRGKSTKKRGGSRHSLGGFKKGGKSRKRSRRKH